MRQIIKKAKVLASSILTSVKRAKGMTGKSEKVMAEIMTSAAKITKDKKPKFRKIDEIPESVQKIIDAMAALKAKVK